LILDDSTSAVDTATDANIRQSFAETIPGTTKIIIAQRISSVQHADKILVLDDGKISGFASHDELLQTNAIYREISDVQQQGSGDFDAEGGYRMRMFSLPRYLSSLLTILKSRNFLQVRRYLQNAIIKVNIGATSDTPATSSCTPVRAIK
jgi:ABC-type multidrug transport system, ATPase and permease components